LEVMMKKHPMLALASALLVAAVACVDAEQADTNDDGPPAAAATAEASQTPPPAQKPAPAPPAAATPTKFVPPIRGQAELGFMKPVTKRVGNEIVTTIKVKNLSTTGSIAGLKVDEYWYDKAGDPVSGDTFRYRKPLMPGEVIDVTLRTPVNPKMDRNSYNFSHANGEIKTKQMPKF
jgi:hypothetical protein